LAKNVRLLNEAIATEGSVADFRIMVSNNSSQDNTAELLEQLQKESDVELRTFQQPENIGGEGNVVFLLQQATADHIMFLGDDDFLPAGYLAFVLEELSQRPDTRAIVPGIASLYADGTIIPDRNEYFDRRRYSRGLASVKAISYLGHQISGIVFVRAGLADNYLREPSLRNLYPTIFFLGYSCLRGETVYVPSRKILISQDNVKYWSYDASGLLTDVFMNYQLLYPDRPWVRLQLSLIMIFRQPTRLVGRDKNPVNALRAFLHLLAAPGVDPLMRLSLPMVFPVLYVRQVLRYFLRKLK